MTSIVDIPDQPLSIFIRETLATQEINATLLELKERLQLNINILLFCCWFAITGKKQLTKKETQETIAALESWNERILKPLKKLRSTIARHNSEKLNAIATKISANEKLADKIEQLMLADRMIRPEFRRSLQQKFNDVCRNIATYCKELQITMTPKDTEAMKKLVLHLFPDINPEHIKETWDTSPITQNNKPQYNQPAIDELL